MKSNQKIYSINAIVIIIDIFTKLLVTTKLKENDLITKVDNMSTENKTLKEVTNKIKSYKKK